MIDGTDVVIHCNILLHRHLLYFIVPLANSLLLKEVSYRGLWDVNVVFKTDFFLSSPTDRLIPLT